MLGDHVLAWNVEPGTNSTDRRLTVQFNQPQKQQFAIQIHSQTPLSAFPQSAQGTKIVPEGATRFAGYVRLVNDGAVRLEVTQSAGLSQISPEQFPETDATRAALRLTGNQKFAYRFSSADFALRIQADQVLPEIGVSEVLAYRLAENEQSIDAEIELEIREAPLREFILQVPKGYAIARLNAPGLSDYFLREPEDASTAELRLIYAQPVADRQLIQLRLERNKALEDPVWLLPRIDVPRAKSIRGHIGITADAGFRLTSDRSQGLTEIATAFFPRKLPGIQSAFRLSEATWQANIRYERLPQTVQADVLHLFSVGEGVAYGSSLINYVVSGAPVSAFKIELSDEYLNVEFTGKDVRNWQKIPGGFLVQLHTPVSGPYSLLVTCERPFRAQGETLSFNGARPLDAQTEHGHTVIISAYQFQVKPVEVSPSLLPLETGEVPPEYRLFFDAPVLAAYRYAARPSNLKLALSPLKQGASLNQVVDRASLSTHISKEGQILTDAHYVVKSHGSPNFQLTLPPGTELWSALVNGVAVVPVLDGSANLIPLPQRVDPNSILTIDLKLASRSRDPERVSAGAPQLAVPVMLGEWQVTPDSNQRLVYRHGSLTPLGGIADASGFATMARAFSGETGQQTVSLLLMALVMVAAAGILWRWASDTGVLRFSWRHSIGALLGLVSLFIAGGAMLKLATVLSAESHEVPRTLSFLAPVQQANTPWSIEVGNVSMHFGFSDYLQYAWPVLIAIVLWLFAKLTAHSALHRLASVACWLVFAWGALRAPNGALIFLVAFSLFLLLQVVLPGLFRLWRVSSEPAAGTAPGSATAPAPAISVWLLGTSLWLFGPHGPLQAAPAEMSPAEERSRLTKTCPKTRTRGQIKINDPRESNS